MVENCCEWVGCVILIYWAVLGGVRGWNGTREFRVGFCEMRFDGELPELFSNYYGSLDGWKWTYICSYVLRMKRCWEPL